MEIKEAVQLLDVNIDDDEASIKKKFRMMQKKWHPDLFQNAPPSELQKAERISKELNAAIEVINDYITSYGIQSFRRSQFGVTNSIKYEHKAEKRDNLYWDHNIYSFDCFFDNIHSNPDYQTWFFFGVFSGSFLYCVRKLNAIRFAKIDDFITTIKKKGKSYTYEPDLIKNRDYEFGHATAEITLSKIVIGSNTPTLSVRDSTGKEIGVFARSSFLFYDTIIGELVRQGVLIFDSVHYNPLTAKISIQYSITEAKFDVDKITQLLFNLFTTNKQFNVTYSQCEKKGKKPFKHKYPAGGWCNGNKLRVGNFSKILLNGKFYLGLSPFAQYTFSTQDYDVDRYSQEKSRLYEVEGKIDLFDFSIAQQYIDGIISFCFSMDEWLSYQQVHYLSQLLDDYRDKGIDEPMYFYKADDYVAIIKFDTEKGFFTNSAGRRFYYTTDFSVKVYFVEIDDFNRAKQAEKEYLSSRVLRKNLFLSDTTIKRLSAIGIKTIDELNTIGVFRAWQKMRTNDFTVSPEILIQLVKFKNNGIINSSDIGDIEGVLTKQLLRECPQNNTKEEIMAYIQRFMKELKGSLATNAEGTTAFTGRLKKQVDNEPSELLSLVNIGNKYVEMLEKIGITTLDDFNQYEVTDIWIKLKSINPSITYFELYALEGARRGIKMSAIPKEVKTKLKAFVDEFIAT